MIIQELENLVDGKDVDASKYVRQDKISFQDYDFVDLEYVFGYDPQTGRPTVGIPFYAFYKEIKTAQNGNTVYAKTYVAAIEVSGYDAYFEKEEKNHKDADAIFG